MDLTSLASAVLTAQAGALQTKVAASLLKSNLDSQASAVLTLLGAPQQDGASLANVAAGIGGNLNTRA
jgi:hypothetical protein